MSKKQHKMCTFTEGPVAAGRTCPCKGTAVSLHSTFEFGTRLLAFGGGPATQDVGDYISELDMEKLDCEIGGLERCDPLSDVVRSIMQHMLCMLTTVVGCINTMAT